MPSLHWIGKEKVVSHHQDVPYRVLEHKYGFTAGKGEQPEPTHSGNKIIHGDNLEALKSLLPAYEGKIKCIYIDPPYNTGNENWVYNDNVNHPKIKTANIDELKGIDLMSKECEVRYIITINALKEGWDCPFAYVLASLADKSSAVDVEQILGRVLRQPYVQKHQASLLNLSYVLTASAKFNETLQSIVKGLQEAGFSEQDYRKVDKLTEEKETEKIPLAEPLLFPEPPEAAPAGGDAEEEDGINLENISFDPSAPEEVPPSSGALDKIEALAVEENRRLEEQIKKEQSQSAESTIFNEMGDKVKRYKVKEVHKQSVEEMKFPQFFIKVKGSDIFGTDEELLNRESLLKDFKLSNEDTKIDFDKISADMYQVDLEQGKKNEYRPSFTKIEDSLLHDPIAEYILAKPQEKQVSDTKDLLMQTIGNLYPIPDEEIKNYIDRLLRGMDAAQLRDVLVHKNSYTKKIKFKINQLADAYAEGRFMDLIKSKQIFVRASWKLKKEIIPGHTGSSIGKSLYEQEGAMNNFEEKVIMELAALPNIEFWHRNLERAKGFFINGSISNHYPDFIMRTKSGTTIVVETKGDHLDNTDSAAKCRLGYEWEKQAGAGFAYFMIFDKKEVGDAFTLDKAKELIAAM